MELGLLMGIFILGATVGALLAHAWTADRHPLDIHSGPNDLEARARRVQ